MEWLNQLFWYQDRFLGVEWHFWKGVGWIGNLVFSSRFFVQWWATEKQKQVVVPSAFWWLSLFGWACLLSYSLYRQDSVFIFAYVFAWIPYVRNLVIAHKHKKSFLTCSHCAADCLSSAKYCSSCGKAVSAEGKRKG